MVMPHIYAIYNLHANVRKKNDICNSFLYFYAILFIFCPSGTFFVVFGCIFLNFFYCTMIYRIAFSCDEVNRFRRIFEADSDATFLDLHKAILESVEYPDDQMTSFFTCNDRWEKEQEVTLVEMGDSFDSETLVMEQTHLSDLLTDRGQRLIYIFDPMFERCFFGNLKEIKPGHMTGVECVETIGKAPRQLETEDNIDAILGKDGKGDLDLDEDFYGSGYDAGDIDADGFQDLSFEDGTMF